MFTTATRTCGRSLIPAALFDRLTSRITADHPELPAGMPERILDQALAFLGACAVATEPIGPSETVDIGWHAFLLYTRAYADFCDTLAGRFIHHEPDDDVPGTEWPTIPRASLSATVAAIRAAGYQVDDELWAAKPGDCTQCHAGCHDSPTKG